MRHQVREPKNSPREIWCYDGRHQIRGTDCYVWKRYLSVPDPETGYTTMGYAHPVATFGLT